LQGQIPLVTQWGTGRTSSSDGQAFPIAFKKPVMSNVNAKYGRDPVSTIYTHVSDRYAPFHAKAISSTVRDATHVLDGLLHRNPDLQIEEHYTDTSGYTDHIFALCHLLGFRFAPRIRGLADHRLFTFEKPSSYLELRPLIASRIHAASIRRHWDEVARFAASIRQGSASASPGRKTRRLSAPDPLGVGLARDRSNRTDSIYTGLAPRSRTPPPRTDRAK
jgi:TnpA family transposase